MTYVMLKESGGKPIKVKDTEPDILGSRFPQSVNTINGVTFYDNYITFTDEHNTELFVPMSSVHHIEFKEESRE